MKPVRTTYFPTAAGWVGAAATQAGLVALNLPVPTREEAEVALGRLLPPDCAFDSCLIGERFTEADLAKVEAEVTAYFRGEPVRFDCPIDWEGCAYTPFQERALRACHQVGYGDAVTYGDIARAIGSPKASRAVGMAMHINRVSLIVP